METDLTDMIKILGLWLGSYMLTYLLMPRIIGIVTYKRLMDNPNERSSHSIKVPSLGGIGFFVSIALGLYFIQAWDASNITVSILTGMIVLFLTGLKDDLVILSARAKFLAQLVALSFLLVHPSFHIRELNYFLGIHEISVYITLPLAAFVGIFIINAYNLIDGIDGLAGMIGVVVFSVFALIYYQLDMLYFVGFSALVIGTLIAFLQFNLSTKKKIFMGDTGSLIIGFLMAAFTIRLFSVQPDVLKQLPFQLENLPIIIVALLIIPLFDTTRVFTIRLLNRKTPFSPDRNHIHHVLIDNLKLSHRGASVTLAIVNILFCGFFVILGSNLDNGYTFGALLLLVTAFTYFFYRINFSYKSLRRNALLRNFFKLTRRLKS